MKDWYEGFVTERLQKIIATDHSVWQATGITIAPDWVLEKSKEINDIYRAVNLKRDIR